MAILVGSQYTMNCLSESNGETWLIKGTELGKHAGKMGGTRIINSGRKPTINYRCSHTPNRDCVLSITEIDIRQHEFQLPIQ